MEIPVHITVRGAGDSLWDDSSGEFTITSIAISPDEDELEDFFSLSAYGKGLGLQCTDSAIPNALLIALADNKDLLNMGVTVDWLAWSEQGMQPEGGWHFDCEGRIFVR